MAQITELESPKGPTDYFASNSSHNHAWLVLNGDVILGWHKTFKDAQNASNGFSVVKVYKSLGG